MTAYPDYLTTQFIPLFLTRGSLGKVLNKFNLMRVFIKNLAFLCIILNILLQLFRRLITTFEHNICLWLCLALLILFGNHGYFEYGRMRHQHICISIGETNLSPIFSIHRQHHLFFHMHS